MSFRSWNLTFSALAKNTQKWIFTRKNLAKTIS